MNSVHIQSVLSTSIIRTDAIAVHRGDVLFNRVLSGIASGERWEWMDARALSEADISSLAQSKILRFEIGDPTPPIAKQFNNLWVQKISNLKAEQSRINLDFSTGQMLNSGSYWASLLELDLRFCREISLLLIAKVGSGEAEAVFNECSNTVRRSFAALKQDMAARGQSTQTLESALWQSAQQKMQDLKFELLKK